MMLTRLVEEANCLPPTRFSDPQEQYGDSDRGLIEAALKQINALIVRAARSLGQHPNHVELQRSFAKLIGQRDELEQHLATCE